MNFKNLLICSSLLLVLGSCRKDDFKEEPIIDPVVVAPPKPYSITENFENGVKTGYDAADVTLLTGSWNLDGALLGIDKSDIKVGTKSVRIQGTKSNTKRNGILTMNYDVKNLQSVSIKHAYTNFADKQTSKEANPLKARWELQLSKDGGKTFNKIGETVTSSDTVLATATFEIKDTTAIRFRIVNTSDYNGSNLVRLSIDDITFKGIGNSNIEVGIPDTPPTDTTGTSKPAAGRMVTKGADAEPATGDDSNLLFGNPSNATNALNDNYLLDMGYYVESYSNTRGTPNWVSWHLSDNNTTSATGRLDNFAAYSGLPANFYFVQSNSYSGSGFDRGHNCPSADRTSSANANSSTFLMTNMIPQAPNNNQKTWANLENYLRQQVAAGSEVYIVMGSYGTGGTGSNGAANTINNGHVTVPSNVWKVAVILDKGNGDVFRVTNTTRVIAVNTPNVNTINSEWSKYITTVDDIEKATGYDLLSALPVSVQNAIEAKKDTGI